MSFSKFSYCVKRGSRFLCKLHPSSEGININNFFPKSVFGRLKSSPGGPIGHVKFLRRAFQTFAFIDGTKKLPPSFAEYHFAVMFEPDFIFYFHGI